MTTPFVVPPYPYDLLKPIKALAEALPGGAVDLSVGAPCDPPPAAVIQALAESGLERGYPPSIGLPGYRQAVTDWLQRRLNITVETDNIAACVGTKEFVVSTPQFLRLRTPSKDTVLYPAISYPSYAMGATMAGCRPVAVPVDSQWRMDLSAVDPADAERALCMWINTPGNPAGGLDDLATAVAWARERDIPVLSDECYVEFTWDGPPRSALYEGMDGVLAVHSLSKRSNMAGVRAGFYAGDPELVHYLSEVRKHAGKMVPGPVQAAAIAAWGDDAHVDAQRDTYVDRLKNMMGILERLDLAVDMPGGGFYLWVQAPNNDAWALVRSLAERLGIVVAPGEFYGPDGSGYVRIAMVQPDNRMALVQERLQS